MKLTVLVLCFVVNFVERVRPEQNLTVINIVHINDFHARFEETNPDGTICKDPTKCIGGYARLATIVKRLIVEYRNKNERVLYLNAGDNFQGK